MIGEDRMSPRRGRSDAFDPDRTRLMMHDQRSPQGFKDEGEE